MPKKKLSDYVAGLPMVTVQSLIKHKDRLKDLAEEYDVPVKDALKALEGALGSVPAGRIPGGVDMQKLEEEQEKLEEDIFNESTGS